MAISLYLNVLTAAIGAAIDVDVGVGVGVGMNRQKYEEALSTHVKEQQSRLPTYWC